MNLSKERELRKALKNLKKEIIFTEVIPKFPVVTEEEIIKEITRLKYKPGNASVVDVFVNLLKTKDISDEEIEKILPLCILLGVAHSKRQKIWTAFSLEEESDRADEVDESRDALKASIKHFFLANKVNAILTLICVGSLHWMRVVEKKILRTHRLKFSAPIYIAHFIGEPFIFISNPKASNAILLSISNALGYEGFKKNNLNGHDLESMLSHLHQKGIKRGFCGPTSFEPYKNISTGKDFCLNEERRKYIDNLMGPNPPKLANYAVQAKNVPWQGTLDLSKTDARVFDMKIVFKTDDTVEMFKNMAEHGILKIPPPKYVQNLLSTGRNSIKLRVPGSNYGQSETDNQTDA